jgi:hypothetical protein
MMAKKPVAKKSQSKKVKREPALFVGSDPIYFLTDEMPKNNNFSNFRPKRGMMQVARPKVS